MFTFNIACVIVLFACMINAETFKLRDDDTAAQFSFLDNKRSLLIEKNGHTKLSGRLGIGINEPFSDCSNFNYCKKVDDDTKVFVNYVESHLLTITWISKNVTKVLKDCYNLQDNHWFGGPERWRQLWPLEKMNFTDYTFVMKEDDFGAVGEPYWLSSSGVYIFVSQETPLFVDQDSVSNEVCFSAKLAGPYIRRDEVTLRYSIGIKRNVREAHLHAIKNFLGKPIGIPNKKMVERPIWSTWARYKRDVNDSVVRKFAKEIVEHGYTDGQFEIDDDWETCYGALDFRTSKFGEIIETVVLLKEMGFRVTLWVHPFVNLNCELYTQIGRDNDFFVKNESGSILTQWWNSNNSEAQYLDFSKPVVRDWFLARLNRLRTHYGIDSFKFDAGESSWPPQTPILRGDINNSPNLIVSDYVRTCAKLGDMIEVRSAWKTQDLPVFLRMIDKDSRWGSDNGLYTLITTLLQFNINGYPYVLPDMIGGNGYNNELPSPELFVRWLQASIFMPAIQFSYVPWDYANFTEFDVMAISKKFLNLRKKMSGVIIEEMTKCVSLGHPLNAPLWWIAPDDERALREDTEFLLGEDLIVAPVIEEGARSRKVYLPKGVWFDGHVQKKYYGPIEFYYDAPIDVLPYFYRSKL